MSVAIWPSPARPVPGALTIADMVDLADATHVDLSGNHVCRGEQAGLLCCVAGILVAAFIQIMAQPLLPTGPLSPPVVSGYAAR